MKNEKFLLLVAFFCVTNIFSQNVYYKLDDKPIMTESYFEIIKKAYAKVGEFTIKEISSEKRKDSIIKKVEFKMVKLHKTDEKYVSPYAKHEAKIGQHFPIEQFFETENTNFSNDALNGKPTVVNFWFIRCPPCREEIPVLNQLKKEFGDAVNFIAITFDPKKDVDVFLAKTNIDFKHITDARKQTDALGVNAFPMNLILDKNGNIIAVKGQFSDKKEVIEKIKGIL